MRILLLTHSFNSLSQRLFGVLQALGHTVSVELDIADAVTEEAVAMFRPDVVLAPFLKRRIPETVWARPVCLVVHPGIPGDRGPSALDWAIHRGDAQWGVTVLQAVEDMDAGEVWAWEPFAMRPGASKSSLYRREVTQTAVVAVLRALGRFVPGSLRPGPQTTGNAIAASEPGQWNPLMRQNDRRIVWPTDTTATILQKIAAADGSPGVLDTLFDQPCRLFDAHPASAQVAARFSASTPAAYWRGADRPCCVARWTAPSGSAMCARRTTPRQPKPTPHPPQPPTCSSWPPPACLPRRPPPCPNWLSP